MMPLRILATFFRMRAGSSQFRRCSSFKLSCAYPKHGLLKSERVSAILCDPKKRSNFEQLLQVALNNSGSSVEDCCVIDDFIARPLIDQVNLRPSSVCDLLDIAVSPDLETFLVAPVTLETRLHLLSPNFVLSKVVGPLSQFGIVNPTRTVSHCPNLFIAAMIPSHPVEGCEEDSILSTALHTLGSLLSRKDLTTLVKNFPEVLTRPKSEIIELHAYLKETMGLAETSELVLAAQHPHQFRHSTLLHIATCPAWRLPIEKVVARHTILLLANQWPPTLHYSQKRSIGKIVGELMTCTPSNFHYWFEYTDGDDTAGSEASRKQSFSMSFSADDVNIFEDFCKNLKPAKSPLQTGARVYKNV